MVVLACIQSSTHGWNAQIRQQIFGLVAKGVLFVFYPSFFFCCRATMGISSGVGTSFCTDVHSRMKADGTMMVLWRIMPSSASSTQNSGVTS